MKTYPVLIDNINDDNESATVFPVVYESHSPDLDVPLERLHISPNTSRFINT